jgi:hypothetical protein
MKYEIHKLTPERADDYIRFFATEDHSTDLAEHKCYCVCWASDDHRENSDKMSTAENRRKLAKTYVANKMIKGYLAYDGYRVVGWCNANDKIGCKHSISWLRNLMDITVDDSKDKMIKSVFCFTDAKDYREKRRCKSTSSSRPR